ncbi:MAG: ATP-dependent sacrificial sulfur transferase LarE [bacterium]
MNDSLQRKYEALQQSLRECRKVLVALSGGLDSSFLLYAALDTLGPENTYAAIGDSASLARAELDAAKNFCTTVGLPEQHLILATTAELDNPAYRRNAGDRCFFCKQELYGKLRQIAAELGEVVICDGANASDVGDHRPGMRAAREAEVRSPLLEAELDKDQIRELAKDRNLKVWDKPQSACLASRIPYNSEVTSEKLSQVERAEAYLRTLGFTQLRVRHHDKLARIELPAADLSRLVANGLREQVAARFRELGFLFTTLDLAGFRSGSMNVMLKGEQDE